VLRIVNGSRDGFLDVESMMQLCRRIFDQQDAERISLRLRQRFYEVMCMCSVTVLSLRMINSHVCLPPQVYLVRLCSALTRWVEPLLFRPENLQQLRFILIQPSTERPT